MELRDTTIGKYGRRLPLGVVAGVPPALEKDFDFRPWRWKEEKEISAIQSMEDGPGSHSGKLPAEVLAHMLTEWGGDKDFQARPRHERVNAICSAFAEDVIYAWLWLRKVALGDTIAVQAKCGAPGCKEEWPWNDSIDNISLACSDTLPEPEKFRLLDPLAVHGKTFAEAIVLPAPWRGMYDQPAEEGASMSRVMGQLSMAALRSFIADDGTELPATATFHDEFSKRDFERLTRFVGAKDRHPSINLKMSFTCPAGHTRISTVDWGYDFFFGAASLPLEAASY